MPGPQRRRKVHHGDTHLKKRWRLRCRTKDLDQIDEDLEPKQAEKLLNQELDLEKPGFAQFYCVHCARHFIDQKALDDHFRTKVHKRRMKALEDEPYSIAESERAGGLGSYVPPKKRRMETLRREGEVSLPQPVQETATEAAAAPPNTEITEAG
ncbi:zinc finger protein 593 homolog [Amphibalanus amphitrite]|uniref:zinc finger protein 593 homolog n=1 Tax=Amphibalanus amphitrite TaxID=1232801 RepID=UPI001C908D22|nr:zinc finger protein 593 homolog [Amphibalanus amphitrite]XP_043198454.1 zinc finger protein 593 homolog [Amphibalanus amphitrite]XP_043198455.1 zinc finger protein 593 homolog [Amphibalanus amphitrite]XP_043198456.1 zinc finger protein 593 homolog [Amphibalanus amphitrite]